MTAPDENVLPHRPVDLDPAGNQRASNGERTTAVRSREGAVTAREDSAAAREGSATAREDSATVREDSATVREDAATDREETSTLREAAVQAREDAARAKSELEELMDQVREANESLVVASMRAQRVSEEAETANHLKDEFLAMVSHELRTPLNAILGWARMLASLDLPPERVKHGIATIERNAAALAHLVDDLLDVSRIVAGTVRLLTGPVDLIAVVQAAIDVERPVAAAKHVELAFSPDAAAVDLVDGDAGRLQQVVWNLIANAVKFTPDGGRVDVVVERVDDAMEVRVTDTGCGIDPDLLPHVFERFRQADSATTRRDSGLGLGLAIVRQLVDLHGGTVRASSSGKGHGATFTVRLPLSIGAAPGSGVPAGSEPWTAAPTVSPTRRPTRLDNLRILVVDNSEDGRMLTSLVLTQAGARVTAVASGDEALRALAVEGADVLVSAIGLADEDGYTLIGKIRQAEALRGGFLPAVALTGYARAEDRERVLAAGFQVHLPKPMEPAGLTAAIAALTSHV